MADDGRALIAQLIHKIGGAPAFSEKISKAAEETITAHAVRKWPQRGVPHKWRLYVNGMARRYGFKTKDQY